MEILSKIVYVVMLLSAVGIVVLVLLQHGKGADMGTGFGAGASGSLFGASGSANFLSRTTAVLAGVFFVATLGLAYFATNRPHASGSVMQNLPASTSPASSAPATALPADAAKTAPAAPVGDTTKQAEIPK
jgi:preprotein translocase subunit SecG